MADGGASSFIMLVTALLVSGAASTALLSEWNAFSRASLLASNGMEADAATSVGFAGDPAMITYVASQNQVVLFLVNSGELTLLDDEVAIQVDGLPSQVVSIEGFDASTGSWQSTFTWAPGSLARVVVESGSTAWSYNDGDDVVLNVVVRSEAYRGSTGSDVLQIEGRIAHA